MDDKSLKALAESYLKKNFSHVEIIDAPYVIAKKEAGRTIAGGSTVPQKLRAFSLIALQESKADFCIEQRPAFERLGAMLDMSRGGVMRVAKIKDYMTRLAFFGANEFLLYMEDTYTLDEYPHFGYLRGAYTDEELLEIGRFAEILEMEVIPCIQTLGHMEQYLAWGSETAKIKDTAKVLLCDCDETYRFIEAEVAKMRKVFTSRKIHIGMDEAHDVGLGNYLKKYGYTERHTLLKRHLSKVTEICKKYGFEPMMWSDMFFRISSPTGDYYELNNPLPDNIAENIPSVSLVYWDYIHKKEQIYEKMIDRHERLEKPIIFAGGLWTWAGLLPRYDACYSTMLPAMRICKKKKIGHVIATMWGDDGCETDYFRALSVFGIFSEYCYLQKEPTIEEIQKIGELISGVPTGRVNIISKFHETKCGKQIFWSDIVYNLTGINFNEVDYENIFSEALQSRELKKDAFADLIFRITLAKVILFKNLQSDYKSGKTLAVYTEKLIPELIANYRKCLKLHRKNWKDINKAIGFEKIEARYAATIERLKYYLTKMKDYENGVISQIEELEYAPIYGENHGEFYSRIAWPAVGHTI